MTGRLKTSDDTGNDDTESVIEWLTYVGNNLTEPAIFCFEVNIRTLRRLLLRSADPVPETKKTQAFCLLPVIYLPVV